MLLTDIITVIYDFAPLATKAALGCLSRDLAAYHRRYLKATRPVSHKLYKYLLRHDSINTNVAEYYTIPNISELFVRMVWLPESAALLATLKMLIDNGADVSINDNEAIRSASTCGSANVVKMILQEITTRGNIVAESFKLAAEHGHENVVMLLLGYGADPHHFADALYMAASHGHTETVSLLLQLLLDRGADINASQGGMNEALRCASYNGHIETLKLLLDHGADIHATTQSGANALSVAAQYGATQSVKLLLDRGADIHANNDQALYWAVVCNRIQTTRLLLDRGADIHAAPKGGSGRFLRQASKNGFTEIVKLLLDRGADIHAKSRSGSDAISLAAQNGHTKTVSLLIRSLLNRGAKSQSIEDALSLAAQNGHTETVSLLIRTLFNRGTDIQATSKGIAGALRLAVQNGHAKTVKLLIKFLIDRGANIHAAPICCAELLHLASQNGHKEIVKLLLRYALARGRAWRNFVLPSPRLRPTI